MTTTIQLPCNLFSNFGVGRWHSNSRRSSIWLHIRAPNRRPQHAYIEQVQATGGLRAFIKGTRIGVDTIVGYVRAGYAPRDLAGDVLPHVTLAQIYDALSYYEDDRSEIDALIDQRTNTPEAWRARLVSELGEQQAQVLLGER